MRVGGGGARGGGGGARTGGGGGRGARRHPDLASSPQQPPSSSSSTCLDLRAISQELAEELADLTAGDAAALARDAYARDRAAQGAREAWRMLETAEAEARSRPISPDLRTSCPISSVFPGTPISP